eukprot:COSAG02_NODE_1381_length_12972_cov_75.630700_6_plen_276_part_00
MALDVRGSALVRSELRSLCEQRPTGTPASFERPPKQQATTADPSSAVLTAADGSVKGAARSSFRRSRVRVMAQGRSGSGARPQSAPARSSEDLSAGYLALKRRHFASELRGRGSSTQLGAGMAISGVAHTASQDSIGRSSGMPQRVRRRRSRPRTRPHATAIASEPVVGSEGDGLVDHDRSFVPHEYSTDGPEWRALTANSAAVLTQTTPARGDAENDDELLLQQLEDELMVEQDDAQVLPDAELIDAGRPVPEGLLTIRPEYSDDLSKITNRRA